MKEFSRIVFLCVGAAIVYGIAHDQVTARVCVEYFTVGHIYLGTDSPTLLGFAWGVLATWWFGLLLGILLAMSARIGALPKLQEHELRCPLICLLLCCGIFALLAGITGYALAQAGAIWLLPETAANVPARKHAVYLADLWAHGASYLSGSFGAVALCIWAIRKRKRLLRSAKTP